MKVKFNRTIKHGFGDGEAVYYEAGKVYDVPDDLAQEFLAMQHVNVFVKQSEDEEQHSETENLAEQAPADAETATPKEAEKTRPLEKKETVTERIIERFKGEDKPAEQPATQQTTSEPQG